MTEEYCPECRGWERSYFNERKKARLLFDVLCAVEKAASSQGYIGMDGQLLKEVRAVIASAEARPC